MKTLMCDGAWNELSSIDILRKRFNLTYDEARYALKMAGDDLIEALSQLEREKKACSSGIKEQGTEFLNGLKIKMDNLKHTRVSLKHGNKDLLSFSAPVGIALGYLLWRRKSTRALGLVGAAYAASRHCRWEVKKEQDNV